MGDKTIEKKSYSLEEMRKIAPNYRGDPKNFDPEKLGKRNPRPTPKPMARKESTKPKLSGEIPTPAHINTPQTPTPQRNESIISEAIFGADVSVIPIDPRQNFASSYAKIVDVAKETYGNYLADNKQMDRVFAEEEFSYYCIALLWVRLIDIKAKQGRVALTTEEKEVRKVMADKIMNVPAPIHAYLSQIGNVVDKMGKETEIEVPNFPIAQAQNMGGYIANAITAENHNVWEEVPCLGIAADVVMAVASNVAQPQVAIRIGIPLGSYITSNLPGFKQAINVERRVEIRQRLAGQNITAAEFPEYIQGTRFNLRYLQSLSDLIGQQETYRVEKMNLQSLTANGGESQVIITRPIPGDESLDTWRNCNVQATSAACESTAQMGASFVFGFQIYKEEGPGPDATQRAMRWSCLAPILDNPDEAFVPWVMPANWIANRNDRRNLPAGIGTERFRASTMRQLIAVSDVIRRMIKTTR